jgi:assimilatory nitrate reductase catalytic subunit
VGCGVRAEHTGGALIAVQGDTRHPANAGRLCVKGSALADTQRLDGRLLQPHVNGAAVSWDSALDHVAAHFRRVIDNDGPDAVAFYLSGQLLTEDYYVANKLMKGFIGSANVDTNSRLCMSSAVAAHTRAFGEDVVPCNYDDIDHCELLVLVGSNAAWAHPVLYQRIASRRASGAMKVVVIDPRRTASCDSADLHLPIKPGMDAALFNALLARLDAGDAVNRDYIERHSEGFVETLAAAHRDARDIAARCGLNPSDITTFFDWFSATPRTLTLFSQGVNQASNGTDKASSIIHCHLATGRIGAPGMGPFSITGQPNAMGGREVGGLATQLAAHRGFSPSHIDAVARFWNAPNIARGPGLKAVEMFDAVADGRIKAIWIMGTNPAVSLPRADAVRAALQRCPFVVVSDCVTRTDTTALAQVLLPALGWGEKDGTVTNTERCISRQRGFLPAPVQAKPDWWIVSRVAQRLGFAAAFAYEHPHEIFVEHAALSRNTADEKRLFDISALADLTREQYDALTPLQWPLNTTHPYSDGVFSTASGRARFTPINAHEPVQRVTAAHPFVLNSGRMRDQWHTMTRTGVAPKLFGHVDTPTVQINIEDAARLRIAAGDLVELHNAFGQVRAIADTSAEIASGQVFYPMHWSDAFAWPARVCSLIDAVTDPHSGQPENKHGAVALKKMVTGRWLRIVSRTRLHPTGVQFWTATPSAHGWRHDIALADDADADEWFDALAAGVTHDNRVDYRDSASREERWMLEHVGTTVLLGFSARTRAALPATARIDAALGDASTSATWYSLSGGDSSCVANGPLVCTCFEVSRVAITSAIAAGADSVEQLGRQLRCGTNCGSCVPELRGLIAVARTAQVAAA